MQLSNKNVLITGASEGLGAALASALGRRGARLALVARTGSTLQERVRELREAGVVAHGLVHDVGDKAAIYPLVGSAQALLGGIDVLIHNASTLGPTPLRPLLDTECEDFARVLEVNLLGPFRLTKAVAGSMALRGSGSIVHVSSDGALEAYPNWGPYSVSKAALDHLSRIWAAELDATGVQVLSIDPGEMATRMHRDALPDADPASLADPHDVAEAIVRLLASGGARNGARVVVPALGRSA
jgi:NAD(P)-dependent dehydrogenase (short-subunit alcohol dehydrogenase family)